MNLNIFPALSQDSGGDGGGANGTDRSNMEDRGGQRNASPPPDVRARHELQTVLAMQRDVGWKDAARRIPRARSAEAEDEKNGESGRGRDVGERTRSDGNVVSGDGKREPLTEEEVDLALEGLDAAEQLERSGTDPERALRLYEVSLEALVRALSDGMPPGYDVPFVRGRAGDALTRAEGLKANLEKRKQRQGSTGSGAGGGGGGGRGEARGRVAGAGAGGVLSSLLNYPRSNSKKKVTTATGRHHPPSYATATQASSASRARPAATGVAAGATTRRRSTGRPTAKAASAGTTDISTYYPDQNRTARTTTRAGARTTTDATPTHTSRRVTVRIGDDELTKVVKTEMYVDLLNSSGATHWSDVAGLRDAKRSLQEAVILPLLRPDLYTGLRSPPRGILLYGPPGTGKTMLARAAACESRCNFFACSASGLMSKWVGEGEKLLRALFKAAREVAPSIVFFDEIDSLLSTRKSDEHEASRRFKTEFMVQVDGVLAKGAEGSREAELTHHVLVLGCSNCPWDLDDAVVRRFPRRIYVPLPDSDARRAMLTAMLDKSDRHSLSKKQVDQLVSMTEGYSCSDLKAVGSEAAFGPLRDVGDMDAVRNVRRGDVRPMNLGDFREALRNNRRSVGAALLKKYDEWEKEQSGGGG